jgi:hypothetical protein
MQTADELRDLWASPRVKDQLRKRNRNLELVPSYSENTDALDQYLRDIDDDDIPNVSDTVLEFQGHTPPTTPIERNLKQKRQLEILDEIIVEPPPKRR